MSRNTVHSLVSGCKVNLFLHVGPPMPSGMHPIDSLFLPLDQPCDRLEVSLAPQGREGNPHVSFFSGQGLPLADIDPADNTLTRAYAWFAGICGFAPRLRLRVEKNVPHGAGLGGGSANAAALLLLLRHLAEKHEIALPSERDFLRQSVAVGADVPFFLLGKAARAAGMGEELTPCAAPFPGYWLLLLCPEIRINTGRAFAGLDRLRQDGLAPAPRISPPPSTPHEAPPDCGNDFEALIFREYPELAALHAELAASDASLARLSGTGSSLFAIYRRKDLASSMGKKLASRGMRVYMHPLPKS